MSPPQKIFGLFYLEIALFGAFWCVFKVYIPIFACHFCDRKGDWYDGAWIYTVFQKKVHP